MLHGCQSLKDIIPCNIPQSSKSFLDITLVSVVVTKQKKDFDDWGMLHSIMSFKD
jgi:hypothetical protein